MSASIISSNTSADNIPIQFSSFDYSSSSMAYSEAQDYDPIPEGFHLSKLNEETFRRAIQTVLEEDLEFKQLYLHLQHDLKIVSLNDTRIKEMALQGVHCFFNDNFSMYMRGVDAQNLSKLVVVSSYNEADEREKKKKSSRSGSKKRAWTKKANIIQSSNKCNKRTLGTVIHDSDEQSYDWFPDRLRVMRTNPLHHQSQDSFDSDRSYRPLVPYNPLDDEVISLSEESSSSESEQESEDEAPFCLAAQVQNCFKSLLQTRKSSALLPENQISSGKKQCHYCGLEFEDQKLLEQHFKQCASSDVHVTIPEPEKYLSSQKTPQFPENVSQGSGGSFSFKWSVNTSVCHESQLKSVLIDLNPQVKQLQTWIVSQHQDEEDKIDEQDQENQQDAQNPEEFTPQVKEVTIDDRFLSIPEDTLLKSPQFSRIIEPSNLQNEVPVESLVDFESTHRVIEFEEPSELEKSPEIVKYKSPSRRKNSVTSYESTTETEADPRRVKWFTEYLQRKCQICPYCSQQIKEAKSRSIMKAHMSECMSRYLKYGVKRKWAIFGRNELVGLPEIKTRHRKA